MKKLFALALALLMLLTLAACAGDTQPTGTQPPETEPQQAPTSDPNATPVYEFVGEYVSTMSDVHHNFDLVLKSDGTLHMERGVMFWDVDDFDEEANGSWSEANGTLTFRIDSLDGSFSNEYEVPLENGGYQFVMNVSMASYIRPITMTCTTAGFVPAGAEEPTEPAETTPETEPETEAEPEGDIVAQFDFENGTGSMAGHIKLYADGTAAANYDMASMSYTLYKTTGTWEQDEDGNYVVSLEGNDNNEPVVLTSTQEDGVYSITWAFVFEGGGAAHEDEITLTYTPAE